MDTFRFSFPLCQRTKYSISQPFLTVEISQYDKCHHYYYCYKSEKTFKKNAKICRDDYAKKYSNKVYIGMAVCKGRGDDIHTKLNIHSPIPTSFLHVTATAAVYIIMVT